MGVTEYRTDCFAAVNGNCRVLSEVKCAKGKCRFYKTKEQLDREEAITYKRLKDLGVETENGSAERFIEMYEKKWKKGKVIR